MSGAQNESRCCDNEDGIDIRLHLPGSLVRVDIQVVRGERPWDEYTFT